MTSILVVDDSSFMREIIKDILVKEPGISIVGEADNGITGFELYKMLNPEVVTLDIVMEKVTGISTLESILEYDKNASVIMITSIGQEKYIKQCLDMGAKGFIIKPFSEEDVLETIRKVILELKKW